MNELEEIKNLQQEVKELTSQVNYLEKLYSELEDKIERLGRLNDLNT